MSFLSKVALGLAALIGVSALSLAVLGEDDGTHYTAQVQPPILMQAEGIPWEHEVRVSLPANYETEPEQQFPVLWITDGSMYHGTASEFAAVNAILGNMPNIIVVSVGYLASETRKSFSDKRRMDFLFKDFELIDLSQEDDPAVRAYKATSIPGTSLYMSINANGDEFLDFLIDKVRPTLADNYRMANDHTLFGHSGGSMFTSRAIFERPGGFDRYIFSSGTTFDTLKAEIAYAENNTDLDARVFIAAGDLEVTTKEYAPMRLVSNTLRLAENLAMRDYPSLDLEVRVFRNKDHASVTNVSLSEGMLWAYEDIHQYRRLD